MVETSVITGVIVGIAEIIKKLGISSKFIPIVNLVLAVILNLLVNHTGNIGLDVFHGLVIGLTASGLYSGVKNVMEGVKENIKPEGDEK